MKQLIALIVLLGLSSCGKEAETLTAEKSLLPKQTVQALNTTDLKIDSAKMRSMTFLMYPTPEDLDGFEYKLTDANKASWETVLADIPYANRLTIEYGNETSDFNKVMNMVTNIMAIGESRDAAFRKMTPMKRENDKLASEIIKIKGIYKSALKAATCYYKARPRRGEKYDCRLTRGSEFKRKKIARSCKDFDKFLFTFDSTEQQTKYEAFMAKCAGLESDTERQVAPLEERSDELSDSINTYDNLRKSGESLVLEMLQNAEKHNGKKVYVATGATKEKVDEDEPMSSITFGADNRSIKEIKLLVDFGLNFDREVTGYQEYSTTNGKIQNVTFETLPNNVTLLTFDLYATKTKKRADGSTYDETMFVVSAELSMTNQDYMDIRFVGETKITYPDGSKTRGAMKLEFDIVRE